MGVRSKYNDANSDIIENCKKGDRMAFFRLYNLYAKAMYNISHRILNDSSAAEEVLQDSFLKVFQKIDTYNSDHAFGAWLKRIVINGSLDVLKKKKIVFVQLFDVPAYDEVTGGDDQEEDWYDVETVRDCIADLSVGYRTILSLYAFENYTHKEIAALLGISEGTSKSQYNRARKRLAELVRQKTETHARPV
jgi:RNA polymerase sigma-70 factor (ECF subfamily)